jgi:hypothetical protein
MWLWQEEKYVQIVYGQISEEEKKETTSII